MIRTLRRSLRARLLLITALCCFGAFSLLVANNLRLLEEQLQSQLEMRANEMPKVFSSVIAIRLASNDYARLRESVDYWGENIDGLKYFAVTDADGRIVAMKGLPQDIKTLPAPGQRDGILHLEVPVHLENQSYGTIYLGLDSRFIQQAKDQVLWQTLVLGVACTLGLIVLLSLPITRLTHKLRQISKASGRAGQRQFGHVAIVGEDEIATTARHFNEMLDELERYTRELQDNEQKFRAIADYTYAWENWFGPDGNLRWVSPAVERHTGYTADDCLVMTDFPLPLVHVEDQEQVRFQMKLANSGHSGLDLKFRVVTKDSRVFWMAMSWQPIRNVNGESLGYRSSVRDISHQQRASEELVWQAEHDHLTGLYNRRAFEHYLQQALKSMRPGSQSVVMLYIDIDQFKLVNDTCGHILGDQMLIELTQILQSCVVSDSDQGVLARLGGDEFAVLLTDCSEESALTCANRIINRIREHNFIVGNHNFRMGASIGVAAAQSGQEDFTEIMIAADTACYAAKEHGRNRIEIYTSNDEYFQLRNEEFRSIGRIMSALEEGRFILYAQCMQTLHPGQKTHAEILIRLKDADGQVQAPARFIEAAERYNLMPYIDRWVVENTCRQLAEWKRDNIDTGIDCFAINVSGSSLSDSRFPDFVHEQIQHYGVDPSRVCFEITESYAVGQLEIALRFIERVHSMGSKLALDDFGSGLSSFAYLKRFAVDYLKIDGMFVKNLDQNDTDRAVVATMVQLARIYDLETIVEFVHNDAILNISKELGCSYAQGYACHVPEPLVNLGVKAVARKNKNARAINPADVRTKDEKQEAKDREQETEKVSGRQSARN